MKKIIKNQIFRSFFVLAVIILSSCNFKPGGGISLQPASLDLEPPEGPPAYRQGWSDGCESGANAYSNTFYKMAHAFDYKFDAKQRRDRHYYQAWKDAFIYCSVYWERSNQKHLL